MQARSKRILDLTGSELARITPDDMKRAILASEGRTIMAEVVATAPSLVDGISNVEIAASMGADIVLLNMLDILNPKVEGIPSHIDNLSKLSMFVLRYIGNNLEPSESLGANLGRRLTETTVSRSIELGSRLIAVTGNPGAGVTWNKIEWGVELCHRVVGSRAIILGGKMHGGGVKEDPIYDFKKIETVLSAGADGIIVPAPYTSKGSHPSVVRLVHKLVERYDALLVCAIGTSQEGSFHSVVRSIALHSKACGCDIHHIGDSGYRMGIALPGNIWTLSLAIRGIRHTLRRVSQSHMR